jgi:hypothetical protein
VTSGALSEQAALCCRVLRASPCVTLASRLVREIPGLHRALFDIPREICYLNAASWSPLPIATQEAGRLGVARKGKPWAIDPALPQRQFERARRAAARLINAETGMSR